MVQTIHWCDFRSRSVWCLKTVCATKNDSGARGEKRTIPAIITAPSIHVSIRRLSKVDLFPIVGIGFYSWENHLPKFLIWCHLFDGYRQNGGKATIQLGLFVKIDAKWIPWKFTLCGVINGWQRSTSFLITLNDPLFCRSYRILIKSEFILTRPYFGSK